MPISPADRLSEDDIAQIMHRMRRAGCANLWTGTSGTLASDIHRLLGERMQLLSEIAILRSQVAALNGGRK